MSEKHGEWDPDLLRKAIGIAATAHNGQLVPGTDLPYLFHLNNVLVEAMQVVTEVNDPNLLLLCAVLHDTVEDTETGLEEIELTFGEVVSEGVSALTKDGGLPKEKRMKDSLERILKQAPEVGMVKMADRIVNLSPPPSHWTREKRIRYQGEARMIHQALAHLNSTLGDRLNLKIREYTDYL